MSDLDGRGRQLCKKCHHRSIAGMVKGEGRCPFHWAAHVWGLEWASKSYPTHHEAKKDA